MFCRRCYRNMQNWDITAEEFRIKIMQGAVIIDVRSRQEFREGHLEGAINIPEFEARNRITKEILNKNQLILIYCQYGGRSRNVCRLMRKIGYNNVYNLYGGLEML